MRKKIIPLVAMIIVLAVVLTGCNLFTVNAERDADQVVASVEYQGMVSEITKSEFTAYFNNNYSMFVYYGYAENAVEAGEMLLSMLAKQKMVLLMARAEFAEEKGVDPNPKFDKTNEYKGYDEYANYLMSLLGFDEQAYVLNMTNKMFVDKFDELVKEAKELDRIQNEDKEENNKDDEDIREPRPVKPEEDNTEFKADDSITEVDVKAIKYFVDEYKPTADSSQFEKDAYDEIMEDLEDSFLNYFYYLAKQAESRLVTKYSEVHSEFTGDIDVNVKYYDALNEQLQKYKDASAFKSAYEGATDTIIFHNGQYVKVNSILLKFSEEQEAYLKAFKDKYAIDGDEYSAYIKAVREALVFGTLTGQNIDSILADIPGSKDLFGLKVYVTNPDYKEGDPKEEAYLPEPIDFLDAIADIGNSVNNPDDSFADQYYEEYGKKVDINSVDYKLYVIDKKLEIFTDMIYKYNDDDGMFQGKDYVETPYEQDSSFVVEYTALVRQLLYDRNMAGEMMVNIDGAERVTGNIVATTSKVRGEEVTVYTDTVNEISFIINDYGVHVVILTDVPFSNINSPDQYIVEENKDIDYEDKYGYLNEDELALVKKATSYYTYKLDAIVAFDEETGKALTLRESLEKSVREAKEDYTYSEYEKSLLGWYGEDVFDASDDKAKGDASVEFKLVKNNKVYNSMVSYFKQIDKANEHAN